MACHGWADIVRSTQKSLIFSSSRFSFDFCYNHFWLRRVRFGNAEAFGWHIDPLYLDRNTARNSFHELCKPLVGGNLRSRLRPVKHHEAEKEVRDDGEAGQDKRSEEGEGEHGKETSTYP